MNWKKHPALDYEFSDEGGIRHADTKRPVSIWYQTTKGYPMATLGTKKVLVHREMARLFLGNVEGRLVDHIDRDNKNNSLANLRICSMSQSNQNRVGSRRWRGVHKHRQRWVATLKANGHKYRSSHGTRIEACHAYDALAREHHGAFAVTNFAST